MCQFKYSTLILPTFGVTVLGFADAKKFYGAVTPEIHERKLSIGHCSRIRNRNFQRNCNRQMEL
ncbi:MAG: hypothetical protein Q4A15_11060 [Prevotellaceae bacterium]|nr:hypothetical protein [Prevotellaceae bacterium]